MGFGGLWGMLGVLRGVDGLPGTRLGSAGIQLADRRHLSKSSELESFKGIIRIAKYSLCLALTLIQLLE